MAAFLIPLVLVLAMCWYLRSNILLNGKPFPRGYLLLILALGIIPIFNIVVLIAIVFVLINWSINNKIEMKDTKINRFLKN